MNATILREYTSLRRAGRLTASEALAVAKRRAWFAAEWTDQGDGEYISDDGTMRLRLLPDQEPFDAGDLFNPKANPDIPARALKRQETEFFERLNRDGVWGYEVERRCGECHQWQHIDSCWGFDDVEYCREQAIDSAFHARGEK